MVVFLNNIILEGNAVEGCGTVIDVDCAAVSVESLTAGYIILEATAVHDEVCIVEHYSGTVTIVNYIAKLSLSSSVRLIRV